MEIFFISTYAIWFLSEILINRFLRSEKSDKKNADKGTLYLIWFLVITANFSAVFIANKYIFPIGSNEWIKYFGILLIYIGIILRISVIRSLGQFFTVDVTIRQTHKLKKDGFYKYVRHPSYFASLLSFIGFGIALNNLVSLILIFVMVLAAFLIRIKIEERTLISHFGSEYLNYKKSTKTIIPFIY